MKTEHGEDVALSLEFAFVRDAQVSTGGPYRNSSERVETSYRARHGGIPSKIRREGTRESCLLIIVHHYK